MHFLKNNPTVLEKTNIIENKTFQEERALYNSNDLFLKNVTFKGEEDGESALKESSNLVIEKSFFHLRYPLWHVNNSQIIDCEFFETCRAPFWYDKNLEINNAKINSPKIFRECNSLELNDCKIVSTEPFWNCKKIIIKKNSIEGEYAFFNSKLIYLEDVTFQGKYSFQYTNVVSIKNCILDTKDAFWHAKNVYCENCTIKGEYLAWYSNNLTFKNCVIESHQPFCYSKNIKLIDCKMPNCDLAFEYSSIKGNILGKINSIKNPLKGKIYVDSVGEIIKDNSKYKTKSKIIIKK